MRKLSIIKYAIFFLVVLAPAGPGASADTERPSWEYYLEKATVQFRGGMNDYAILSLQRCLDINPRCFQAANLMGEVYSVLGRKSRALDYYRQSLAINERQADIQCVVGELCEFFVERDQAFTHYSRAVTIDPGHVKANCSLVRFYLARGDRAAAARHFDASYRQAKLASGALLERARTAARGGDAKEAAVLYRRVLDEAPSLTEAYHELYELARSRNEYAAAAEAMERLKFVRPDYEKAYVLLGYVYFTQRLPGGRKRRLEQAIVNLQKAVELNPDNYETCYSLSEIYHYLKNDVKAKEWEEKGMAVEERVEGKKSR